MAKEKGNPEEIKSKLLLARNEYIETALHVATEGNVEVQEKIWVFFKQSQLNKNEVKNELLLAKTRIHTATGTEQQKKSSLEELEIFWC